MQTVSMKLMLALAVTTGALMCSAMPANADVVALMRGGDGTTFTQTPNGQTSTASKANTDDQFETITAATNIGVADTLLTGPSNSLFQNNGIATSGAYSSSASRFWLLKFDLSSLSGFNGGTITDAQLRLTESAYTTNWKTYIVTSTAWSEGNKSGGYPGATTAEEGASTAHPNGLNTGPNQKADGSAGTATSGSWGPNGNAQFQVTTDINTPHDTSVASVTGTRSGSIAVYFNVTDFVKAWAAGSNNGSTVFDQNGNITGAENYGFATLIGGTTYSSDKLGEYQPVLFIDYTPATQTPEPASLSLLGLGGLMLLKRRRKV